MSAPVVFAAEECRGRWDEMGWGQEPGAAIIVYVSQVSGGSERGGVVGWEPDVGGYNNVQCCQVSGPAARRDGSPALLYTTRSFPRTLPVLCPGLITHLLALFMTSTNYYNEFYSCSLKPPFFQTYLYYIGVSYFNSLPEALKIERDHVRFGRGGGQEITVEKWYVYSVKDYLSSFVVFKSWNHSKYWYIYCNFGLSCLNLLRKCIF